MEIRIDEPGAGEWVMERVEGFFTPGWDHSVSSHRDGKTLGGFVVSGYTGVCSTIHMASEAPDWCSRDMLWLVFDYAFNQLGCRKLLGPVRSDNYAALDINLRGGWHIEAVVRDVFDGAHMVILAMTRETCPWLNHRPVGWRPGMMKEAA